MSRTVRYGELLLGIEGAAARAFWHDIPAVLVWSLAKR
jgi:hypothetical protein